MVVVVTGVIECYNIESICVVPSGTVSVALQLCSIIFRMRRT